jgi:hypothetical protein
MSVSGSGTFTGALSGTSATFSGGITSKETETTRALVLNGRDSDNLARIDFFRADTTTFIGRIQMDNGTNSDMAIRAQGAIKLQTGGSTPRLTIDSTGAATFSSSVTAGGRYFATTSVNDNILEVINTDTTNGYGLFVRGGGTASGRYVARFKNAADSDVMWIGPSNVGIGTTSPQTLFTVSGANQALGGAFNTYGNVLITSNEGPAINRGGSFSLGGRYWTGSTTIATFGRIHGKKEDASDGSTAGYLSFETTREDGALLFERMRIDSAGIVMVGTSNTNPAENNVKGVAWYQDGRQFISSDNNEVMRINRKTSDGVLVFFHQDGTAEGNISVSGTTVSYNGGHLSRYSQTETYQRIEGLLKGTLMSNLDKMAE